MSLPALWLEVPLPPADPRLDAIGRNLDLMGKRWVRQAEVERVREWKAGMDNKRPRRRIPAWFTGG